MGSPEEARGVGKAGERAFHVVRAPGEGGWREGWRRLRNRAHGILRSTRGVRENWLDPGPSEGEGSWEASGACTQWGTKEPVWAKGPSLRVGLCGGLSSLWAPRSCRRAGPLPRGSGPLAGRPSRDPINQTRLS